MLKTIAFRPPVPALSNNRLFEEGIYEHFGDNSHWIVPYREMGLRLRQLGYNCVTEDCVHKEQASALVFFDLPNHRQELLDIRKYYPSLKIILQLLETPLGRLWAFDKRNHEDFDAVLTYRPVALHENSKYFHYKIPYEVSLQTKSRSVDNDWSNRRLACIVSNVPNVKPLFPRRSGLGLIKRGWRLTPASWWNYVSEGGSLYGDRLNAARTLSKAFPQEIEIYGPSWDTVGDKNITYCWKGVWKKSKLELLRSFKFTIAFENCDNDMGYISEKILDAFASNSIPVYLGNRSVKKVIPEGAFIDATGMNLERELPRVLSSITSRQGIEMLERGREFINNEADSIFGSVQYSKAVLKSLRFALST